MEALSSPKTLVNMCHTARDQSPEDTKFDIHCRENLHFRYLEGSKTCFQAVLKTSCFTVNLKQYFNKFMSHALRTDKQTEIFC